jgi:hypothetical protein
MNENFESRSKDQNESNVNAQVALLEAARAFMPREREAASSPLLTVSAIDDDTRFLASVSSRRGKPG